MTQRDRNQHQPTPSEPAHEEGQAAPDADAAHKPARQRQRTRSRRRGSQVREPFREQKHRSPLQSTRTPDYLLIGHICADLQPDGSVILGGTALYSALTAAQLGARVAVLTRGAFGQEVAGMKIPSLEPFVDKISIIVQEADIPTTFINEYRADRRVQTMPHWAGPIDLRGLPPHWRNAKILHLGPVADEVDPRQAAGLTAEFVGITPQGWMREWPRQTGGRVQHIPLRLPGELLGRVDCAIISIDELSYARDVVERVGERRLGVITKDEHGARIIAGGQTFDLDGFRVPVRGLDGAGDVFAAAFFLKAADRTASARTAGRFANAVAALSLREVGPFAVPTLAEVNELLEE